MLCHSDNYDCVTIDLEHGGSMTARYLGHGGTVTDLSVSGGDPRVFLTACRDACARLFDIRAPLPVVTFDACSSKEPCYSAALAHPDGIPTVFTGTSQAEQIKMWDVRARAPVYELATGNNQVKSLAWDSARNCLYAATKCGYRKGASYRRNYHPSKRRRIDDSGDEDGDEDDDGKDGDQGEDEEEHAFGDDAPAWPKNAYHLEEYFGYAFDAGNHRIYRYAFKEDPDVSILP
ncbi:hypothetical protein FRC08_015126 [Ceratobasidium sp. 394]|nr:hypothetical protein FRC08_015126 [Ceratobasidium sp. 394]